ncbi:MAG: hypothetical protein IPK99_08470 [Flavobacteriales bacterium]|nr:hypothetical protein [Flavobacteriales bacterium]
MMRNDKYIRLGLFATLCLAILAGCKKDDPVAVDLGYGYFPTDVGRWIEYQVDSSWIDEESNVSGLVSYRMREVIDSAYLDPGGRQAQRIERFVWDSLLGQWRIRDVWTQTRGNTAAERTEEDRRFLKLTFPVKAGEEWNLNAYNSQEDLEVGFDEVHTTWSANGLSFDSTAVVVSDYPNNQVDTLIYQERYAKRIGLVERSVDSSETQNSMTRGFYFRQVILAYGP